MSRMRDRIEPLETNRATPHSLRPGKHTGKTDFNTKVAKGAKRTFNHESIGIWTVPGPEGQWKLASYEVAG